MIDIEYRGFFCGPEDPDAMETDDWWIPLLDDDDDEWDMEQDE